MIAPSLDGALREPANEILAAEQIDQERRNGADQHGGACDVVGVGVHLTGRQRDQRRGDRLLRSAGEDDAEQEFVPNAGELPDHGDDEDRRRQRKEELYEYPPETGAVEAGRLDEIVGNVDVIVAAEQRREREALDHVNENEAVNRVREMQ